MDRPANDRPFSIIKNATPVLTGDNGELVIEEPVTDDLDRAAASAARALAALAETARVGKALNLSEMAQRMLYQSANEIWRRMDAVYALATSVEGSYEGGSLDEAVGTEFAALAAAMMALARAFGVAEMPDDEVVEKRGAKMARARMDRLVKARDSIVAVGADLGALMDELQGDGSVEDAASESSTTTKAVDAPATESQNQDQPAASDLAGDLAALVGVVSKMAARMSAPPRLATSNVIHQGYEPTPAAPAPAVAGTTSNFGMDPA